ncbi:YbaB/EbfC family nucleoid-associated protein [Nocardia flavorosea]|uniref:YbaB/EbfC family nucleoid-associated protein n=1 Tax=Nocardia flavorosea TaxID=53429 RepID=A0A846YB30_9NOCA|nr:YbaB/EbfC family nucleoid-associated protein [Nocardia flavorosea]NKY54974.1 YbaB/EbfC family nucleoid-associated protein [Nocardia flavorosea]
MDAIVDGLQEQIRRIGELERERRELRVSAAAEGDRVTVTVDAQGRLVDLELSPQAHELSHAELVEAILAASGEAAAEAERRGGELFDPLHEQRGRMPKLSELVEGFPGMEAVVGVLDGPERPETAKPVGVPEDEVAPEKSVGDEKASPVAVHPDEDSLTMEFDETVDLGQVSGEAKGSAVLDRDWV